MKRSVFVFFILYIGIFTHFIHAASCVGPLGQLSKNWIFLAEQCYEFWCGSYYDVDSGALISFDVWPVPDVQNASLPIQNILFEKSYGGIRYIFAKDNAEMKNECFLFFISYPHAGSRFFVNSNFQTCISSEKQRNTIFALFSKVELQSGTSDNWCRGLMPHKLFSSITLADTVFQILNRAGAPTYGSPTKDGFKLVYSPDPTIVNCENCSPFYYLIFFDRQGKIIRKEKSRIW